MKRLILGAAMLAMWGCGHPTDDVLPGAAKGVVGEPVVIAPPQQPSGEGVGGAGEAGQDAEELATAQKVLWTRAMLGGGRALGR